MRDSVNSGKYSGSSALGQWRKLYLESLDRQLLHAYRPLGTRPGKLQQSARSGTSAMDRTSQMTDTLTSSNLRNRTGQMEMRLRVLLTNGSKTVDLLWLRHTGSDIYYGFVGHSRKFSYHASGVRHMKGGTEKRLVYDKHHPLDKFVGHFYLGGIVCHQGRIMDSERGTEFRGKKSDAAVFLDSRTLPDMLSISFGLLEPGSLRSIPKYHTVADVKQLSIVTSTNPWIYVMVMEATPDFSPRELASSAQPD